MKSKDGVRRWACLAVAALTLFGAAAMLPSGTAGGPANEPQAPSFSCALRVAEDGSLVSTPVNFTLPALRADAAKVNSERGPYCDIINNSGRSIPYETVRSLDENFTLYIWPNDTAAFGTPRYAKINIIIITYDNMGGVAGYFSSGDPDAIYLDYDDLNLDLDVTAHEFEHLIHYDKDPWESIWVNEGCAEAGIYVTYGGGRPGLTLHFGGYSSNTDNDFTVWDNTGDYGGAGLWTIYCYEHFGGANFTRALVADQSRGIQSYNNQLAAKGESFTSVFQKWVAANWLNNHTVDNGEWGYTGVWNYVGHTIKMTNYPYTCSSAVDQGWSADYLRFEPTIWNKLQGDLLLNVTFTSGTPYCAVAVAGKVNTPNPDYVVVPAISGNRASVLVPNIGGDNAVACLVVSGLSGGCSYAFESSIVDLTPPNTSLSVSPLKPNGKNGWYVTRPQVSMGVNELNCTGYYHWDGGDDTAVQIGKKLDVPEGEHTLYYHSVDRAGNVEAVKSRSFKVDLAPPNTTATLTPAVPDGNNSWYRSPPYISLSCDTPGANLTWSWDEESYKNYTLPVLMVEGLHRFNFRGEDQAGNFETVKTLETRLDTEPPTVGAALRPGTPDGQNGWYIKTPYLNLSCSDPYHPIIHYRWDNGTEGIYQRDLKPPAGIRTLTFWAEDEAGNRGPDGCITVKTDAVAPGLEVTDQSGRAPQPDGTNGWFRTALSLNFTPNETGNVTVYYRWDSAPFTSPSSPLEVPEGYHTLYYYAVDEAGNRGKEKSLSFKMDTLAPAAVVSVLPEDLGKNWYHSRPTVNLSTEPDASIRYSIDGGQPVRYIRQFEMPDGEHNLTCFATDQAGNNGTSVSRLFRVDTLVPRLTLNLSSVNFTTKENLTITAMAVDENGIQDYLFDFGDGSVTSWTNSSTAVHSYTLPGPYVVKVRARDRSGLINISEPLSVTVRAAPPPPTPTPPNPVAEFFANMSVFVYIAIGMLVVAAVIGAVAGQLIKKRKRAKLYIDVERAEQERERRHTKEIHDEDPLGLPRSRPHAAYGGAGGFRGMPPMQAPAYPVHRQAAAPSSAAHVSWEPEPTGTVPARDETRVDFGDVKVIERKQEEVVYEAEIGAPVPIWAMKKPAAPAAAAAQRTSAPARVPASRAQAARPAAPPRYPPAPSRRPAAPYPEDIPEVPAEPVAQPPRHAPAPRRQAAPAPASRPEWEEEAEPDLDGFMKRIDEVRRR